MTGLPGLAPDKPFGNHLNLSEYEKFPNGSALGSSYDHVIKSVGQGCPPIVD